MKTIDFILHATNFLFSFCLLLWLCVDHGEMPMIKQRLSDTESKVNQIEYHIQQKSDSIIINNYIYK